ncbi:hypothetical protein [uncultured Pseudacidovorax sp.]|uniref:hypothetical protein n=1 Tax=uncultured Pseudacidovorax sp. TaxID=679313 RepID=UPI0025ECB23A|nr:hypothetical protein [uncultured Pseudacidovorax sp.]
MAIEGKVKKRLMELYAESHDLQECTSLGQVAPWNIHKCGAWLTSAQNLVNQLVPAKANPYRAKMDMIAGIDHGYVVHEAVAQAAALLLNLSKDAECGLIEGIVIAAQVELFDDFLDHATVYLKAGKKQQAGVIAGVFFEDSIRKLARKFEIPEKGVKLDELISELQKSGQLTALQAKRARVAASLRTSATHAQWDEFVPDDVRAVIEFSHELILTKLEG